MFHNDTRAPWPIRCHAGERKPGLVTGRARLGLGEAQHAIVNYGDFAGWKADAIIVALVWNAAEDSDLRLALPVSVNLANHISGHVVFSSIDASP